MDITFSLQNGQYIAEFKVTSEFNLHIEKGVGSIQMFQRTSGTFFDKVEDFKMNKGDVVCDFDSGSFIGEKTIRLVSSVEPRYCFITTDGEVTEIKSQSKEVEVTANGTMDIIPDAGFSYLSAVKVKTNVPKGEGGSGGGSNIRYYRADDGSVSNEYLTVLALFACAKKGKADANCFVGPIGLIDTMSQIPNFVIIGIGVDFNAKTAMYMNGTYGETNIYGQFADMGYTKEQIDAIPTITEEEFYNLNA